MARILLIDDDPLVLQAIAGHLVDAGHEVLQAREGREGVEVFKAASPAVVVTDILMPEKEGIETILAIRALSDTAVIIAISGGGQSSPVDLLEFARKAGANSILKKPFSVRRLRELISASLDTITLE
jgi:DNA-binding response OmpR family regulator